MLRKGKNQVYNKEKTDYSMPHKKWAEHSNMNTPSLIVFRNSLSANQLNSLVRSHWSPSKLRRKPLVFSAVSLFRKHCRDRFCLNRNKFQLKQPITRGRHLPMRMIFLVFFELHTLLCVCTKIYSSICVDNPIIPPNRQHSFRFLVLNR